MFLTQNRIRKPLFDSALIPVIVIFLLACGNVVAAPFISTQNQYFAHALSGITANAENDWFRNTVDPYPLFSAVARLAYSWAGIDGIRVLGFFGTAVAMISVFLLARLLARQANRQNAALLGAVAIGLTLLPHTPHAFYGVAGQYIIFTPAYLQPSMFGCFLLLAVPCLFAALTTQPDSRKQLLTAAFVLAALSCALHPTYIVCTVMLLAAAFIANVWQGGKAHVLYFVSAACALLAITVAANPALLSMAFSSPEYDWAAQRFAFERIPHHTLITDWSQGDIIRFIIAVAAVPIAAKKLNQPWLAHFLAALVIMGTTATLAIQFSGPTKLALLFPWRISVFVVPIACTVIAVWIVGYIEQLKPLWNWRRLAVAMASCVAVFGCTATFLEKSPAVTDERTALVRAVRPTGVGLVPLDSDNLRLNAPANIYVDWESPPYASNDLIEWWYRIDQVRQFERDVDRFCSTKWHSSIRWIMLPAKKKAPYCISRWKIVGRSKEWRILQESGIAPSQAK